MRGTTGTLFIALLLGHLISINAQSGTIAAASCNPNDVQAAMNRAQTGDTVVIPAGTCRWTAGVEWNAPPNVTVRGTVTAGVNATILIDDFQSTSALFRIGTHASGTFRLSSLTLRGGRIDPANTKFNGLITLGGESKQLRVDRLTCDLRSYNPSTSGRCIYFTGWLYGVVDHSTFELPDNTGQALQFAHDAFGGLADGDGAWAADTAFGSHQFIFAEDNTFTSTTRYGTAQDCLAGGRFVWRFNTMKAASLQTHPTIGRGRGCRASEIYRNAYVNNGLTEPVFNIFFLSSGTALVWGNATPDPSEFKHLITFHAMRASNYTYPQSPTPDGWGYCGTEFNGQASNWDGNTSGVLGYPCLDQPGRGRGDLLAGDFPNIRNAATNCSASSPCAWPRQSLEPVYMWANSFSPMPGWGGSIAGGALDRVAPNRDWYVDENANCSAGAASCASGVGSGARGQRPSSCTAGTAWWSTDQGGNWNLSNTSSNDGTLDKCTATNTWTNGFYTPFTYPHPLVNDGTATGIPARPSNLRIERSGSN